MTAPIVVEEAARTGTIPRQSPLPSPSSVLGGQTPLDARIGTVAQSSNVGQNTGATQDPAADVGQTGISQSSADAQRFPAGAGLIDPQISPIPAMRAPTLAVAADMLDDIEETLHANQNRLRQLTRKTADKDGEMRGPGLDERHPDVARQAALVAKLAEVEHDAVLNLQRLMRKHPLEPWRAAQKGVGEKQFARLLAAVGDPYWNTLHGRPRTVSELWAFCGLHTVSPGGDHTYRDSQDLAVAARRQRGQRANWSTVAKSRAYLIAAKMLQCGNRELYDTRKAATEGREHSEPCVRCGPAGHPAQPGTPWSDAHRHADALRIVSKQLLKEMWMAARDIHAANAEGGTS